MGTSGRAASHAALVRLVAGSSDPTPLWGHTETATPSLAAPLSAPVFGFSSAHQNVKGAPHLAGS